MARKKADPALVESVATLHLDGWANVISGLGVEGVDKRMAGRFARSGVSSGYGAGSVFDREYLDDLYSADPISGRIIDLPVDDMTREWIDISGDDENAMGAAMSSIDVRGAFSQAKRMADLHGGAVILMGANDGAVDAALPLAEERVQSLDWLTVMDRWDIDIKQVYADPMAPKYLQPELYSIRQTTAPIMGGITVAPATFGKVIHESRIIRFDGANTSARRRATNRGWCLSVLERTHDVVRDFMAGYAGASYLLQDFAQGVFTMKGLAAALAQNQDGKVLQRLRLLNYCRSVLRMIPIDTDEAIERKATPVSGMPELLDRLGILLSASTGIPITLLLGEAPGGLQATGDSDHRNWYNVVRARQETTFRAPLARVMRLLGKARGIAPSDDDTGEFTFTFRPLWQPSEKEVAETRFTMAQADEIYLRNGVVDPDEIRTSRFAGEAYGMETVLDDSAPEAPIEVVDPIEGDTPEAPPPKDAADPSTAFNGAQVTAMKDIVLSVAKGEIPRDSGIAMLTVAFPVDEAGAQKIMGSAGKGFEPTKPEPPPMAFGKAPPVQPPATPKGLPIDKPEKDGAP